MGARAANTQTEDIRRPPTKGRGGMEEKEGQRNVLSAVRSRRCPSKPGKSGIVTDGSNGISSLGANWTCSVYVAASLSPSKVCASPITATSMFSGSRHRRNVADCDQRCRPTDERTDENVGLDKRNWRSYKRTHTRRVRLHGWALLQANHHGVPHVP